MEQYGFSFDVSRCSGCMACVVACQDQNDHEGDGAVAFRVVTKLESGSFPSASIAYFSLSCQHCGDAPCVAVCPTGALRKGAGDGAVFVDADLCIGCHSCELACSFGGPRYGRDGKMAKCDLCRTRREEGMKPACVRVCPTRALDAGPMEEIASRKARDASLKILESLVPAR